MENEKSTGNKYTVKDAAIIGIFCAVMFVVFMVYSTLTGASLFYSMIFNAAGAALILAPFYVYMCMKVGKHGPALVYNIMWAIIAGLMMGPFMIPWFLGGGIIAELSMCGKDAYHDIKRVSISWVITALVRAAHGMSEIWFFKDAFLARAILKDAPIIVLDEATAFADAENEHQIQLAFERLTQNKTVLMIAHRLSTIQDADLILVFKEGQIAERGTHEELVALNGIYSSMWKDYQTSIAWKVGKEDEQHD